MNQVSNPLQRIISAPSATRPLLIWTLVLLSLYSPRKAFAHAAGMATESCSCHSGGSTPTVLITPDLTNVSPGQMVNLTVSVSATNGKAAGFFLEANTGKLSIVDSGTKLAGGGVTQNATRTGSGSAITFKVGWTAPAAPGGVDFRVWANSANGKNDTGGDGEGTAFFSMAFGCTGSKFYLDGDADGVGSESSGYTIACGLPPNYSTKTGDCADNDPRIFPGNPEVCDGRDNNCDGKTDEGLELATLCTDTDGDGHGVLGKATSTGCGSKGFGLCDNDCNDSDPMVFPGATETCNEKDDNCNGKVDEIARPTCGVGYCKRIAPDCNTACVPGPPLTETCNNFDDDCDGVDDNGTDLQLCGAAGLVCRQGLCAASSASGGASSSGAMSSAGAPSSGGAVNNPPPGGGSVGEVPEDSAAPAGGCRMGRRVASPSFTAGTLLALGALLYRRRRRALACG
jgi:putative metal-binding protein